MSVAARSIEHDASLYPVRSDQLIIIPLGTVVKLAKETSGEIVRFVYPPRSERIQLLAEGTTFAVAAGYVRPGAASSRMAVAL
jgi:hypothetical protein